LTMCHCREEEWRKKIHHGVKEKRTKKLIDYERCMHSDMQNSENVCVCVCVGVYMMAACDIWVYCE
jgi:hypothetical protein